LNRQTAGILIDVTAKIAFWKWSAIGAIAAGFLILAQANAVGGFSGLLQVGEVSRLAPLIEAEVGDLPLSPNKGHDTQIYYAIGIDLAGEQMPELFDHGPYRYRRILYPAVASLFGLLEGTALLVSMIVLTVVAMAVSTGLAAAIAIQRGRSDWIALAVLLNPGVWLSTRLLTADMMALALMLLGLHCFSAKKRGAPYAFALSGLSKEAYLLTPAALALSRDRRRWKLILIPVAVLTVWMAWLTLDMGNAFTGRGNVGLPFVGMVEAGSVWATYDAQEVFYLAFGLLSVAVGLAHGVLVKGWLRRPILFWSVLGVISSSWVWDLGNNAARVFAPILVLVALSSEGLADRWASHGRQYKDAVTTVR
jgi:hypothetical protein